MTDADQGRWGFQGVLDSLHWFFHISFERLIGFAIVTYFSGWHYLDAYFSRFNANEWNAWFNDYTVFLYSFFVFADLKNSWAYILAFTVFMVIVGLLSAIKIPDQYGIARIFFGRFLIAAGVLWFLYHLSHDAGERKAEVLLTSTGKRVEVYLTENFRRELEATLDQDSAGFFLNDLTHQGERGKLRLIWRTNDDTIILLAGSNPPTTYRIPNKFIVYIDAKLAEQTIGSTEKTTEAEGGSKEGK